VKNRDAGDRALELLLADVSVSHRCADLLMPEDVLDLGD
jgi:hypothetical protein